MVFWPFHGIAGRLTERRSYEARVAVRSLGPRFRRSLHFYAIDCGCDNFAVIDLQALLTPQYNTHRFGIFWADTPRHADVLVILGPPLPGLAGAMRLTVDQLPRPRGLILVGGDGTEAAWKELGEAEDVLAILPEGSGPDRILGALLAAQGRSPSGGF